MKRLNYFVALLLCAPLAMGCSEKTQQETKEALDATGEAAGAAAEDAKVNAKKMGKAIESGVDKAKEEFSDAPPNPGEDDPADADAVPESQEAQP